MKELSPFKVLSFFAGLDDLSAFLPSPSPSTSSSSFSSMMSLSESRSSSASMPAFWARLFAAADLDLFEAKALRFANANASSLATIASPVFFVSVTVLPMVICVSPGPSVTSATGGSASGISASGMATGECNRRQQPDDLRWVAFKSLSEMRSRADPFSDTRGMPVDVPSVYDDRS